MNVCVCKCVFVYVFSFPHMVAICGYGRKSEIYKAGYQDKLIASLRHRFELFSTGRISSSLEPFSSVGRGESGKLEEWRVERLW